MPFGLLLYKTQRKIIVLTYFFLNERQFNPLPILLITFEKFHKIGPEMPNPPGDPKIRKIKLFPPEKNISILVMQKQVFFGRNPGYTTSFINLLLNRANLGLK